MSDSCDIEFENNPRKIVYGGQLLRGTVRLNLVKITNVRNMYIRITGKLYASWYEGRTPMTIRDTHLDKKVYFVEETTGVIILEPGTYKYAFEFMLSSNVPSSIEGVHGHVKYHIRVVVEVPRWFNKEFKEEFTLINLLNLNHIPQLKQPLMVMQSQRMKARFVDILAPRRSTSAIAVAISAPVTGYLPQQTVNFKVMVNNQSDAEISQFTVALIQLITYVEEVVLCNCTDIHRKDEEKCLLRSIIDGCGEHESNTIHLTIVVPPTIPTTLSKKVTVTYSIRVKAFTSAIYRNITVDLPITIGSIPFEYDTLTVRSD